MRAALLVTAALGACYSPSYAPCAITCPSGDGCPSGYTCRQNFCVANGDECGDGTGSDASMMLDDSMVVSDAPYPTGPWTNIMPLPMPNSTDSFDDPSMTSSGLEIFANRNEDTVARIVRTSTTSMTWNDSTVPSELTSLTGVTATSISWDGLELVYSQNASGIELYSTIRPDTSDAFNVAGADHLSEISAPSNEDYTPELTQDRLALVWGSQDQGTGDLYLSSRTDLDPATTWSAKSAAPFNLVNVNNSRESGAFLTQDRLTLYFASNRAGGQGGKDIYRATRANPSAAFGAPMPVDELNTAGDDTDPWVSPDGHFLLFSRKPDTSAQTAIYQATR